MADTEQTFPPRINRGAKCNKEKKVSQCHFSVFFRSLGQVFRRGDKCRFSEANIRKKKRIEKDSCQFCRVKNTKTAIPCGIAVFAVIDLNIYCFINFRPFCMYMFPG